MAAPWNPFDPYHQRGQYDSYAAGPRYQQHGGFGYQPEGLQQNQGPYNQGHHNQGQYNQGNYNQGCPPYQQQGNPIGAQNYQYPNYQYHNNGMGHPAQTQQRPVVNEQYQYGQATNIGQQQAQPAFSKENKHPGSWGFQWGEEGEYSAPRAGGAQHWRPKDDKILMQMRAGSMPATWSEIVETLHDRHTEDDARRRYDELEVYVERDGCDRRQQDRSRLLRRQSQSRLYGVEDWSDTSFDDDRMPAMRREQLRRRSSSRSRMHNQLRGERNELGGFQWGGEIFRDAGRVPRPLSRGPSGIAGWTRYPKRVDQTMGKRVVAVGLGLLGIDIRPSEETGVEYRKW